MRPCVQHAAPPLAQTYVLRCFRSPVWPAWLNTLCVVCTEFKKRFSPHVSSTLAPPNFPSDYMPKEAPKEEGAAAVPSKLKLNFFLPHEQQMKAKEVCKPGDCACRLLGGYTFC